MDVLGMGSGCTRYGIWLHSVWDPDVLGMGSGSSDAK